MKINGREIGPGHPPYIVGEVSGEHRGDFRKACQLIKHLKDAGADAAKVQCFDPYPLAERRGGADKVLEDGLWKGRRLIDLYLETHTPKIWFTNLFKFARDAGITLFSSVFSANDVGFLELLDCPAYKIASREASDSELVAEAAKTGKPVIISTGTASDEELGKSIAEAVKLTNQVAILHCVSQYPCPIDAIELDRIATLKKMFGVPVGFSDHTAGTRPAKWAVEAGACIIEKHITLSRESGGPDVAFSLEPDEFAKMVKDIRC